MQYEKRKYVALKKICNFPKGTIKTKRVWCNLLHTESESDFKWLIDTDVLMSKKLYKLIH